MTRLLPAVALLMAVLMVGPVHAGEPDSNATLRAAVQRGLQQLVDQNAQPVIDAATKAVLPGIVQAVYPPGTNLFLQIVAFEDGLNHLILGLDTTNLKMFAFRLQPDGIPTSTVGRPFLNGHLSSFKQTGPSSYVATWDISSSIGGLSGNNFVPEGSFIIELTI